jgi:hypothetical protein
MAVKKNDGQALLRGAQDVLQPQAGLSRQAHIEYETGRSVWAWPGEERWDRREGVDLETD